MTLGNKIQEIRIAHGMSQEQFGEMLNITRQIVSKWELDQVVPDLKKIIAISRLFCISADDLFIDRLRRIEATKNHFLAEKRCLLVACTGGTGRGTLECLHQMELALTHMNMRAYDRIPVIRYNSDYMLPALERAGEVYADRLETGFDMYF